MQSRKGTVRKSELKNADKNLGSSQILETTPPAKAESQAMSQI